MHLADDPYDDANLTDPYPLFQRMREAGPAVWLDKYDVAAFTRFAEVREILVDHETFISGAGVGPRNYHHQPPWRKPGILDSDPPMHTPLRAAMADVISPRNMRPLRAGFQEFATPLVDKLLDLREFDAITDLAELFPIRVFGDAVGIPREGRAENLLPHGAMNFAQFGPEDARYEHFMKAGEHTIEWTMQNCARENLSPTASAPRSGRTRTPARSRPRRPPSWSGRCSRRASTPPSSPSATPSAAWSRTRTSGTSCTRRRG